MTAATAPTPYRQHPVRRSCVARERDGGYEAGGGAPGGERAEGPTGGRGEDARGFVALAAAVDRVVEVDLDPLTDEQISTELADVQHAIRRLGALRDRAAGVLESRAVRRAGPGGESHALKDARDRLREQTRLNPGEAKRAGQTGRRAAQNPDVQRAANAGDLPPAHARVLLETLTHLLGHPDRDHAEQRLLEAAKHENAATFGRTCRRLLAELDAEAAQAAQDRRNQRRGLKVAGTEDGMTAVHGQGSGWDAEVVQTAIHAFRRPDAPDEPARRPEQRTWDAFVAVCRAALDAGPGASNRNVRPHAVVTIDHETVMTGAGATEGRWTGPMPWPEVRRHLADAGISRLLTDPDELPVEAGREVRTVPVGLWKMITHRNPHCIAAGCDVPADWCEVMHLEVPYRLQGRLSPTTAAPGCTHHHGKLDRGGWRITWHGGRPILHHPSRPPDPPPDDPPRSPPPTGPPGAPPTGQPPGRSRPDRAPPDGAARGEGPPGDTARGEPPPRSDARGEGPPGSAARDGPPGVRTPMAQTPLGRMFAAGRTGEATP